MDPVRLIQALCIIAVFISSYQLWSGYQEPTGAPRFCDINQVVSCTTVMHSRFGYLFGIPVSIIGLFGFAIMFAITFLTTTTLRNPLLVFGSIAGALFSAYLTYAEFFILHTVCPLCLIIFFIILIISISSVRTWGKECKEAILKIELVD